MREGTGGVARCQPFRVTDAQTSAEYAPHSPRVRECERKRANRASVLHTPRQPSRPPRSCHSSTAENSRSAPAPHVRELEKDPARSAAALSVHEMHAPLHGTYSTSGCISTNTSHRSSPRFQLAMCLARHVREGGAHGVRSSLTRLHYAALRSCQLDSGLNELSRVRAPLAATARFCHNVVPSGRPAHVRWRAGLPWGVAGAALGPCLPCSRSGLAAHREAGPGMREGGNGPPAASRISPPISRNVPPKSADPLYTG